MDLSKLPKLSKTDSPQNDPYADQPQRREPEPLPPGEGVFTAMDIFLSIGIGLLFVFLGFNYAKYLQGSPDAYPAITGTGYVWLAPHPKAGQEIAPSELSAENKAAYDAKVVGREMSILSESSLFLFGVAMVIAGLLGIPGHMALVPVVARRAIAVVAVTMTAAGLAYTLWGIVRMFNAGITPMISMIAVLAGGMTLFMQWAAMQAIFRTPATAGGFPIELAAGSGPGPRIGGREASRSASRPTAASPATSARTAHHRFAHQMLRRVVFEDPMRVVGALQGPGGRLFLAELWEAACRDVGLTSKEVPPTGMESEMTQVGPYSAAIVTLPSPEREGEAYFVGIVLRSYVREDGALIERSPKVLYYALEVADAPAGGPGDVKPETQPAVLCEWQAGDHVRFADRLKPDFNAFREAMRLKVQARQEAEDRVGRS